MDIEVVRDNLRRTRVISGTPIPDEPASGTALLRIESFALTANNVTYGVVGDLVGYWDFYPPRDEG